MHRWDIIRYIDMTTEEWITLQRWMNFKISWKNYSIILMSVRKNAPYTDKIEDEWKTIIYEWHDLQKNFNKSWYDVKNIDQPMFNPSWTPTENWKFYQAAQQYKLNWTAKIVKIYEKIADWIRSYNWLFNLVDSWIEESWWRKVFKFKLEAINEEDKTKWSNKDIDNLIIEHNRLIPTEVKVLVYARDKWRCVKCWSNKNLHYDHILPFSKWWSSTTPDNIQLLCEKCNLKKHDNIE